MATQALNLPDAEDVVSEEIVPTREFEVCSHLLDHHDDLESFYQENGYLFFRRILEPGSVERARDEMLAVAADAFGLVEKGDPTGRWTGVPYPDQSEESSVFSGISKRLFQHPDNQRFLEKVLGEKACMVPIVQYRLYPPNGPVTLPHQDGFYSPGIRDYKPVWTTLAPCPRELGGLTVAIGQHKRGLFHNVGKPNPFPLAKGYIDEDSWATVDYEPGDVLIVHPHTPHSAMRNTSDRLRITLDTRVQCSKRPSAFAATVKSVEPRSITVEADPEYDLGEITLSIDEATYLRVETPTRRDDFASFVDVTRPGMHLTVVREGNRASLLRRGSQP